MGTFIDNCHVFKQPIERVQQELVQIIKGDAYVTEWAPNWVSVYPDDSAQGVEVVSKRLSKA